MDLYIVNQKNIQNWYHSSTTMLCNVYTSIAGEYDVFASLLTSPSSMKKMTKKIEITGIFHRTHRSTIRQFHIINY